MDVHWQQGAGRRGQVSDLRPAPRWPGRAAPPLKNSFGVLSENHDGPQRDAEKRRKPHFQELLEKAADKEAAAEKATVAKAAAKKAAAAKAAAAKAAAKKAAAEKVAAVAAAVGKAAAEKAAAVEKPVAQSA